MALSEMHTGLLKLVVIGVGSSGLSAGRVVRTPVALLERPERGLVTVLPCKFKADLPW